MHRLVSPSFSSHPVSLPLSPLSLSLSFSCTRGRTVELNDTRMLQLAMDFVLARRVLCKTAEAQATAEGQMRGEEDGVGQ